MAPKMVDQTFGPLVKHKKYTYEKRQLVKETKLVESIEYVEYDFRRVDSTDVPDWRKSIEWFGRIGTDNVHAGFGFDHRLE